MPWFWKSTAPLSFYFLGNKKGLGDLMGTLLFSEGCQSSGGGLVCVNPVFPRLLQWVQFPTEM